MTAKVYSPGVHHQRFTKLSNRSKAILKPTSTLSEEVFVVPDTSLSSRELDKNLFLFDFQGSVRHRGMLGMLFPSH